MLVVGLTGGMGSGKSTVAAELARRGAHVVDADEVAREVVAVGQPALEDIRERFGPEMLRPDGSLDRAGLAAVVFADDRSRRDLDAITHPRIAERIEARIAALRSRPPADRPSVVVIDHPLLVETGQAERFPAVVVVVAPVRTRLERLQQGRGIDPGDARARMAAQASDDARRAVATHVIDNSGDLAHLRAEVDRVWEALQRQAHRDLSA